MTGAITVYHKPFGLGDVAEVHDIHDAHLIAAAPDLLAFAAEWLGRQGTDENYMVAKARAAIAKATGEAS